jgi:hypothetical protein
MQQRSEPFGKVGCLTPSLFRDVIGIEPLLEKIRDEMPDTRFVAPLYRSPICVATSGPQRGSVTKFRY